VPYDELKGTTELISFSLHPHHSSVKQRSGYLDTANGRHFYFYQFDSRNDPKNDPIFLWLNGGPGCSSFTGLLQELGPCRVQPKGQDPTFNPYS